MISTFPKYVFIDDNSISEVRVSNMRRSSDFEVGPKRQTAYSSRTMYNLRMNISVCTDDYQTYLDWYEKTLQQGTQWFLMKCPIRGTEYKYRFLEDDLEFRKVEQNMRKTCLLERWAD